MAAIGAVTDFRNKLIEDNIKDPQRQN